MNNTKRDFRLAPPDSVSVEVFDWSHDSYGNPTAHFLLLWGNGKTGAAWEGDSYRTTRRVQVGYRDKVTGGVMGFLPELFPGTCWTRPAEISGDRCNGLARFTVERDHDSEAVPVIFRAERSGDYAGVVTAVFPTLPGTDDSDVTIYARVGQHGTGARGWYRETRQATDAEAAPLRAELESIGYRLAPCKRWTRAHDEKRAAIYHASREG